MFKATSTKVLVVDDDQLMVTVTARMLRAAGYDVITRTGELGTSAMVVSERPDVLLLDLNMPLMTGQQIAAILRGSPARRPILIFYSGLPESVLQEQVRTAGVHGGIVKGLPPAEFVERLRRIVASAGGPVPARRDASGAGGGR